MKFRMAACALLLATTGCASPQPGGQALEPSNAELAQRGIHDCEATYPFTKGTAGRRAECIRHIIAMVGQETPEEDSQLARLSAQGAAIDAGETDAETPNAVAAQQEARDAKIEAILKMFREEHPPVVTTNCTQFGNTTSCQTQ
jgi:hypothetical protein